MHLMSKQIHRYLPLRVVFLLFLVFFFISSLYIISFTFSDQVPFSAQSNNVAKNIENIDDYDTTCSGYTVGRILREQKRILASVRAELIESQVKLQEIQAIKDELQRLIPQKQLELSSLEGEIEAAQRQLEELRENQNVRVFLPFSPISQSENFKKPFLSSSQIKSIDDVLDFSRCSISSFMPISLELITTGENEKKWKESFKKVVPNIVEKRENACLTIQITNNHYRLKDDINLIQNILVFNIGKKIEKINSRVIFAQNSANRSIDIAISPSSIIENSDNNWDLLPSLLPYSRDILITVIVPRDNQHINLTNFNSSFNNSNDKFSIINCSEKNIAESCLETEDLLLSSSHFCFIPSSQTEFSYYFTESLKFGCIPIVLSSSQILPFENLIDWRRASYRIPPARLTEAHFIVRSFEMADVLEMRRMGRNYFEQYLGTREQLAKTIVAFLRYQLQIPTFENNEKNQANPLFNLSFVSPKLSTVNIQPNFDDEYLLGPLESRINSPQYLFNFTEFQLYSYDIWNNLMSPFRTKQFLVNSYEPPAEVEFHDDSKFGFRPIDPGSGVEFSKSLGGNRQREQFTVVLLTYERDLVLHNALERLHQIPYLNKIIVVWNNIDRDPPDTWPNLHVPIEFLKVSENSLNNRFVPWDRIETEAILSLDDDIDLMQQEIILAFRIWRENRDRIVGFPARYHAKYGDSMFYNSNHTCQMSIILTGAAFIHKEYLSAYTYQMPSIIRKHVDQIKNCEDIAMNYLVSHITRKPPIKVTSRWTLKCSTCTDRLSESENHFEKRHECMRFFTEIYGYNPLRFSQFRADSILFKTRLPPNHQKCFKYV